MSRVKTLVTAVAVVAGLAVGAGAANAQPPGGYTPGRPGHGGPVVQPQYPPGGYGTAVQRGFVPPDGRDTDYVVYVRPNQGHDWHYYGRYETRHQADRVADRLEDRGDRVRVVAIRDHRDGRP